MTIQQLKEQFQQGLQSKYSKEEIEVIFYALAEKYLQKNKSIIRLSLHEEWADLDKKQILFDMALVSLQSGEPYQYIIGETDFMGLPFMLNREVLIPRPETEELVEWVLNDYASNTDLKPTILDIGTGSGIIAVTLKKKLPNANVYALDISEGAIEVAEKNATINQVKVNFLNLDLLKEDYSTLPKVDIIVSNPPYIPQKEKEMMEDSVVNFEPEKALFVPDNSPCLFYEKIAVLAKQKLNKEGCVYVEIHQDLMEETKEVFSKYFEIVTPKKDISGNWRMIKCEELIENNYNL